MRGSSPPAQPWWHNTTAGEDEYILDTPTVRTFVAKARAAISQATGPAEALEAIRPDFERLLEDDDWLPARYQAKAPESSMGGGIGQWLLFRSGAKDLSLYSLVVPPDASTPVHDHLAWGLVGLYRGEQEENVFARRDEGAPVGEREKLIPRSGGPSVVVTSTPCCRQPMTSAVCVQPPRPGPSPFTC